MTLFTSLKWKIENKKRIMENEKLKLIPKKTFSTFDYPFSDTSCNKKKQLIPTILQMFFARPEPADCSRSIWE